MRTVLLTLATAGLITLLAIGLGQAGGKKVAKGPRFDLAEARAQLRGAPPELAALHAQSGQLLDGGLPAVRERLRELRGRPVVINKWGSWCPPCRTEFPILQRVATKMGKKIAFLGLNVGDRPTGAAEFLRDFPLPFPSYVDRDEEAVVALRMPPVVAPVTLFLDERGKTAFIHQGRYRSDEDLVADIKRYL